MKLFAKPLFVAAMSPSASRVNWALVAGVGLAVVAAVVVGTGVGAGVGPGVVGVVGRFSRKDSVPGLNVVLPHGVLYNVHHCSLLYEILWHCELAIHVCWHASKPIALPGNRLSFTSPLLTLQMPLKPVCLHVKPVAADIDTSTC